MSKRSLQSIKIFAGIVATLSIVVSTLLLMPLRVQASPDDTSIMKKTLANAISKCYSSTYIHQDITPAGHFSMEDDMFVYANRKKGDILVLDDLGGKMSCEQVFLGSNKAQGLNSLFGKNPSSPASLGYVQAPGDNPSSTRCMSISYKHPGSSGNVEQFTSNSLCFGVLSDGTIDKNSFPEGSEFASDCDQPVCLAADALGRVYIVWEDNYGMHYDMEVAYYGNAMNNSSATSWDYLYNTVSGEASKLGSEYGYTNPSMSQTKTDDPGAFASYTINNYGDAAKTAFQYYTGSSNMDSQKFTTEDVTYLLDKAYAKMKSEGIINEDSKCFVGKDEALAQGTSYAHFNPNMDPQMWCPVYLNTGLAAGKTYNVVGSSLKGLYAASPDEILKIITNRNEGYATAGDMCVENAQKRYDEFVQAWKDEYAKGDNKDSAKLKYYKEQQQKIRQMLNKTGGTYKTQNGQVVCLELPPTVDGAPDTPPDTSGDNNGGTTSGGNSGGSTSSSSNGDLSTCFGQASSLGWIICPVVQLLGSAVDSIYEGIENQFLYVNPELTSSSSSTRTGWSYFRNFANIAFAIALAVIIVSQISGFGITNYGIKKLLPTLIIVAVLVNISFFICQFAVDVSNIVGYSLKDMLESLSVDTPNKYSFGSILNGIVGTFLTGSVVGIAGAAAEAAWPAWILPLLLTLLATIISILFFYLLLGVRQAGIIILVVISPLAIICYALPNTKKLFTRWWQLFSSLLILFPICGALMGGGIFASSLLLRASGETFFFYFVAVLLQVIPFFFIPSLLRSSMSALGNLGVKMSNFGSRFSKGINRSISGTDSYKDGLRRNEMRNAERTFRRIDSGRDLRSRLARGMRRIGATGQAEGLEAAAQRRRARAISKYDSSVMEDLKARVGQSPMTEGSDRYNARLRELEAGELDATAKSYISQYKSSGQADDEEVMGNEYTQALSDLMDSPEDRDVRARLLAAQRILAKSDTGRGRMQNALYASTANGGVGNEGHRLAHSMLSDESGAEIKAKNPGFHSYLIAAAAGRRPEGTFTAPTPGAKDQNYHSSFYDHNKISSLDGSRLAGADETGLDRMLYSARNHRSEWTQQDINDFNMASTDALTNQNINTQPKVGQKINDIRQSLGLARIDTSRRFDSGGNVNVRNRGRRRRNRR